MSSYSSRGLARDEPVALCQRRTRTARLEMACAKQSSRRRSERQVVDGSGGTTIRASGSQRAQEGVASHTD